ncbi:MAG: hypothetical protein IPN70_04625 [Candidatus Moraniibacteriota bacterium]|nr:MAG: hypothetical protein IPN70_04625 [Candidatus Moranbacteria bacterium]
MKNKKFKKIVILEIFIFCILLFSFIGPCNFSFGKCIGGDSILITRTLFHIALSLLIVSPFLFFLRDEMFSKWIRLSVFWFGISTILIMIAPVYWGGWMSFGPTKELVSLWSGILFLLVNIFFIFHYRKGSR